MKVEKEEPEPSHVFVGRKPCGHVVYVACDMPDMASQIGKDVARLVRDGRAVERMAIEAFRELAKDEAMWKCTCPVTPEEQKILDRQAKRNETLARRKRLGLNR